MAFKKFDKNQPVETTDIQDLVLLVETEKAYLVRDLNDKEHWLPKSQVKNIELGAERPGTKKGRTEKDITSLTLPVWLATKAELV